MSIWGEWVVLMEVVLVRELSWELALERWDMALIEECSNMLVVFFAWWDVEAHTIPWFQKVRLAVYGNPRFEKDRTW